MTPGARKLGTRELVAAIVSGAILLASAVYWVIQIMEVIESLRLAYG